MMVQTERLKCEDKVVYAFFFRVEVSEVVVTEVVALLVFGPKNLIEVS